MYHFIINKTAASGQCETAWKKVLPYLKKNKIPYEAHMTSDPAETAALTASLTDGTADVHLIILGGDGTLNLILQNIISFEHTTLSVIPVGSGNDFALDLSISKNPCKALQAILEHPKEHTLDYGVLYYLPEDSDEEKKRRFLISSGVGFDAAICHDVNTGKLKKFLNRIHLGKISYLLTGIRILFGRYRTEALIVTSDGTRLHYPLFLSVSMIHRYEGGGVAFAPHADPSDGLFDVCAVESMNAGLRVLALVLVLLKKHYLHPSIHDIRCRSLTLKFTQPIWFHTDGEVPGKLRKCRMECLSGLRFIS